MITLSMFYCSLWIKFFQQFQSKRNKQSSFRAKTCTIHIKRWNIHIAELNLKPNDYSMLFKWRLHTNEMRQSKRVARDTLHERFSLNILPRADTESCCMCWGWIIWTSIDSLHEKQDTPKQTIRAIFWLQLTEKFG